MSLGSTLSTSNGSTSSSRTRSGSCTSSGMVQQLAAQLSHMPGLYLLQESRRSTSTMLMGDLMVGGWACAGDRKSTRLNSSHSQISYAVFCLKKKKKI